MKIGGITVDTMKLPDGTKLRFGEGGDPGGRVVLGMPGFLAGFAEIILAGHRAAQQQKIRLIACDPVGIGESRGKVPMTKYESALQRLAMLNELGVDKFDVFSVSGGTGDAVGLAIAAPDRVKSVTIASGLGQIERKQTRALLPFPQPFLLWLTQYMHPKITSTVLQCALNFRHCDAFIHHISKLASPDDRIMLETRRDIRDLLWTGHQNVFEEGEGGKALYWQLHRMMHWGCDPENMPPHIPVYLYHGPEDTIVPIGMAEEMYGRLPASGKPELIRLPGGHLCILKEGHLELMMARPCAAV
jgi:pimeloyl-ACP methyl ester carboxylesterase